ncbi:MAG: mechanosensitive ion channel family protein [Pseudomonadota bacterium]
MPMETLNDIFSSLAGQGPTLAATAALLIYKFAASKIKRLPMLPVGLFILYCALGIFLSVMPADADEKVRRAMVVAVTATFACAVVRLLFFIFAESVYKWRRHDAIPKITRDLFLTVSYAIIVIVVLSTRGGVNLVGLITTSAVLTAVIGLAAQNALGNLFASLSIQLEKPFRIGDWIQYKEFIGKVTGVGWEATRLSTFEDETVIIPNLDISKSVIRNYSIPTTRHAMKIEVGVEYGARPNLVREILLGVCGQEPAVLKVPSPVVRIANYGDFAITYQMRFFYEDYGNSPDVRAAVMNRVWYALRRHNIRIPFPVRDMQLKHVERRFEAKGQAELRASAVSKLSGVPILKPLAPDAMDSIAGHMAIEEYGDGEAIVRQGDAGDSLYIIHRGACDVEVSAAAGPTAKIATLAPSAFFGEMSLLTGEPRSATVRAKGDTTVFSIGKEIFRDILVAQPEIFGELARALASRQTETAEIVGRQREEQDRHASRLLVRIKSFFGMAT